MTTGKGDKIVLFRGPLISFVYFQCNLLCIFFCINPDVQSQLRLGRMTRHWHDLSQGVTHSVQIRGKTPATNVRSHQFMLWYKSFYQFWLAAHVLFDHQNVIIDPGFFA